MSITTNIMAYLQELEMESISTRKCLERISEDHFDYKPHPTSMAMGYLALLVAEIPLWISIIIEKGEIDFANFSHAAPKTTKELTDHFEENLLKAVSSLENATKELLTGDFKLKNDGQLLYAQPKMQAIGSSINHWVHHRGQLTVYMRLNEIPVPSIYGPSADETQYPAAV